MSSTTYLKLTTKKNLIVITGPTAIGKTALSIALAKHFNSEILSADSRQFFKEMYLGTAVPSPDELKEIPHHFIQHKNVKESYNVGDYERDVLHLLEQKFKEHDILFMVGGSGLYIKAVLEGLDNFPDVGSSIRTQLMIDLEEKGIEYLQEKVQKLDPDYYKNVDINNTHRLIRALEICLGSGEPYSSFLGKQTVNRDFETIKIGLTAERSFIYDRINKRVDQMMEAGLLEEVEGLLPKKNLNALQTVGYRELFQFLNNEITLNEAIEEIKKNTRRYAKRQLTWLRKEADIQWFDFPVNMEDVIAYIKSRTT